MHSWSTNKQSLCQLPQREIEVYDCFKTHPKINIAEELSIAPRSCNTASISNVLSTESSISRQNILKIFIERYLSELNEIFSTFILLPAWLREIPRKVLRMLSSEKFGTTHIPKYVEARDWNTSQIRYMAWHQHVFKFAVASSDDAVRIYDKEGLHRPIIRDKRQKLITCLAWRPFTTDEMAIGCASGIVFWFADTPKEEVLHAKLLKHQDHYPVTSLEWREDGSLLASASINDANILLWNVDTAKCSPLRRFKPKCCFIRWAPKPSNLFCATTECLFRIWSVKGSVYDDERFSLKSGRVQSAAWSPCGQVLLFANDNEMLLYRLQRIGGSPFLNAIKQWQAAAVVDLSMICVANRIFGGYVQSLVWNQRGSFVAVTFKQCNSVALFLTSISGEDFFITPHGYISGRDIEYPIFICFQTINLFNEAEVLTIGWSNGTVKFYRLFGT